ncbi:MAG TPA: CoA transferase [Solimonas sp.]|nr:CoA transferase [Solimonas sp.]
MQGLEGIRVLELAGHVAGAYCAKLLAGFGADVVRAEGERPPLRTAEERAWLDSGKRTASGTSLGKLLDHADIVIDAWPLAALEARGVDVDTLAARAIVCRISAFGQSGPHRDWQADDITLYAMSGLMHCTGEGARAPLNAGVKIAQLSGGFNAYVACLMALLRRARDGGGDVIDLSLQESAIENGEIAVTEYLANGKLARRNGDNHAMVPWRAYPCADGEAAIIGGPIRHWLKAAEMFGEPALLEGPLADMGGRMREREKLEGLITPWLARQPKRELFHRGQKAGLAWSYLASIAEALADPQFAARGFFVECDDPQLGTVRMPDAPFRGTALRWKTTAACGDPVAAPESVDAAATPVAQASTSMPPLAGIRVLDLTHDWAGPHCARLLADHGAEVIKIEYPQRLDGMRGGMPDKVNDHPRVWQLHRNKRSLTLDLRDETHRRVFAALVEESDVVLENSRPGVMARFGYDYAALRTLKTDIIMVSMSAFGSDGPYAQYAGYGGTLEAICGIQDLTAYEADGRRFRVREMDVTNGIAGACAVMTALWHRQRSGEGQWIDLAESETAAWLMGEQFIAAARAPASVAPRGNRHAQFAPQGCYRCVGDDRWLTLTIRDDAEWSKLAARIGGSALDAAYATVDGRRAAHDALDALIDAWTASADAATLARELQRDGLAAGMVYTAADVVADAHLQARGWLQQVDGDRLPGLPFRFARGGGVRHRGPDLGAANAALFGRFGLPLPDIGAAKLRTAYELHP